MCDVTDNGQYRNGLYLVRVENFHSSPPAGTGVSEKMMVGLWRLGLKAGLESSEEMCATCSHGEMAEKAKRDVKKHCHLQARGDGGGQRGIAED